MPLPASGILITPAIFPTIKPGSDVSCRLSIWQTAPAVFKRIPETTRRRLSRYLSDCRSCCKNSHNPTLLSCLRRGPETPVATIIIFSSRRYDRRGFFMNQIYPLTKRLIVAYTAYIKVAPRTSAWLALLSEFSNSRKILLYKVTFGNRFSSSPAVKPVEPYNSRNTPNGAARDTCGSSCYIAQKPNMAIAATSVEPLESLTIDILMFTC